jgi:hypothetical protein
LQDDSGLGSIRWTSDIFSDPPPKSGIPRGIIWASVAVIVVVVVLAITAFKSGAGAPNVSIQTELNPISRVKDALASHHVRQKLRDPMPPVTGVRMISAEAPGAAMQDEDFVLGVELGGEARAYAINMMGKPETELLNDTLAGKPIAVTFCGTCQSPLIFSRQVQGKTLTLYLNGELLAENMIMRDAETGSDWVQLTGEAIDGPLKGQRLDQISAVWTDWRTWLENHPNTTLPELPNVVTNYRHHPLYSAFAQEQSFFSGLQWGLARGEKARSWPYAQLARQSLVNDVFAGQPLLVVFDRRTNTAKAFDRRTSDTELTFHWESKALTDDQTGSIWNPFTGIAVKGPLKGRQLTAVAGTISLGWAWRSFHPDSETWFAEKAQTR